MIRFNYDKVPQELKDLKRWVLWKIKINDKGNKTKVPIDARNGYGAKSNDPDTWVSYDKAIQMVEFFNCEGLGFMLGNGYFGVDIDHALDNRDLINEFVDKLKSYTEVSQSGEGIHIICRGVLPQGARRKGNIEMYDSVRFFAMTGNLYDGVEYTIDTDRTQEAQELWTKYVYTEKQTPQPSAPIQYVAQPTTTIDDETIIAKIRESKNGNLFTCLYYGQWEGMYPSQSQADGAMCSLLAFWCSKNKEQMDRIFRSSKLYRAKWDERRGSDTYGNITLDSAIAKCQNVYTPQVAVSGYAYNVQTGELVQKKQYDLNDTGNAQRFVDRFGSNIHYNFDNKCWMIYDGKTWVEDSKQIIKTQADVLIEEMKIEMVQEVDKEYQKELAKNIKHLSSNSGKEAMLKEAMHIGTVPSINVEYDKDGYILNCFNGVVDLKTGKLLDHNKNYMCSKNTNISCDLEHEPVRWKKFLLEIFNNNEEMVDYIQEAMGYTLTGSVQEQCCFQCYGDGSNGKSVFLDVLYDIMGNYAVNVQVESITAHKNQGSGANSDIARMKGARFIRTNEPNEGSRFNEGLFKQLVSGDITTARFLYGKEFEFAPIFKLWIATNYKIQVRGTDHGVWRRQRLVPFEVKFDGDKADKTLPFKLQEEYPQILGWAVKGAIKWLNEGLKTPKCIEIANNMYKKEMDIISSFLEECTKPNINGKEKAGDVFKEYRTWAKEGNEYCMTQSKFGVEMAKKFPKKNINGYIYYIGLILKKNDESYVYVAENEK